MGFRLEDSAGSGEAGGVHSPVCNQGEVTPDPHGESEYGKLFSNLGIILFSQQPGNAFAPIRAPVNK